MSSSLLLNFLPFALALGLGFGYKRLGILNNQDGRTISKLVVNLTLPAAAFTALYRAELSADVLVLSLLGLVIPLLQMGLAYGVTLWHRLPDPERGVFLCNAGVTNLGFFLYPIFLQLYGFDALARLVMFDIGNAFMAFAVSFAVARYYGARNRGTLAINWRALLLSPPLLALPLGLFCNSAGVVLPSTLTDLLEAAANANILLVMVGLGVYIEPRLYKPRLVAGGLAMRMGVGLLLGIAVASVLQLTGLNRLVVIMAAGMPTGMTTLIYAATEELDAELAANLISYSLIVGFGLVILLAVLLPYP
jgi:malate permease and related proteins